MVSRRQRFVASLLSAAARLGMVPGQDPTGEVQGGPQRFGTRRTYTRGQARSLTPQRVASALDQADRGAPRELIELLQEILDRSTQLVSLLGTRKRAVVNLTWSLEPADDSAEAIAVAKQAEEDIRRVKRLKAGLIDLLDAIYTGYAGVELRWDVQRGRAVPVELLHRSTAWLVPDRDNPEQFRLLTDLEPTYGEALTPDKWIVHVARAKSGFPIQAGLGRTVIWWALFSNYAIQDWVTYGEKFGSPLRIGKFPAGAQGPDVDALQAALIQLGVDATAVIPAGMDVEIKGDSATSRGADVHERLLTYADKALAKAILGGTLTTDQGVDGAQALGTVHNDVRIDLRDADAEELQDTLTAQLLRPYVRMNWGEDAADRLCPRWVINTTPAEDLAATAEYQSKRVTVLKAALELGVPVTAAQAAEELGIRAPNAGEAVLKLAAPATLPAPPFAAGTVLAGLPDGVRFIGSVGRTLVSPVAQLDATLAGYRTQVDKAWKGIVAQLRAELGDVVDPQEASVRIARLVRTIDLSPYADPLAELQLRTYALGLLQARAADSRDRIALPAGSEFDPAYGAALEVGDWPRRVTEARSQADDAVRYALLRTAADYVAHLAAPEDRRGVDPLEAAPTSPQRTSAVVEATGSSAWGDGRWDGVRDDPGRPYLYYHTMQDDKVRPTHRAMEGRVYPADHPIWRMWKPPNGFGCRCWVTAHTAAEVAKAGWVVMDGYPYVTEGDDAGAAAVPDKGWARTYGAPKHDFTEFPPPWRDALLHRGDTANAVGEGGRNA